MKTGFLYLTEADVDRGVKGSVPPVWVLWVSGSSGSVEGPREEWLKGRQVCLKR